MIIFCPICGARFKRKPSDIKNLKHEPCCSVNCSAKLRKMFMKGKGNHQYGLRGKLNPTFKSLYRINNNGYITKYCPNHPLRNCDDRVLVHRLVAEEHLLTKYNSMVINGKLYLKPELEVHHIDFNRKNNIPNNLLVLNKSEHMKLHQMLKRQKKLG